MIKYKFLFLGLFFVTLGLQAQSSLTVAEDFLAKDTDGETHYLFDLLNDDKIIVLSFFTTTWGSCNIYTPEIVLSNQDFGCNQGDVFYLGINWGADNNAVSDFMIVHSVGFPCASGLQGQGNQINQQYGIASHITALVITPDRQIVGQFYAPYYPTQDTLNSLLLSLGAQMQDCSVGISESSTNMSYQNTMQISPNPILENAKAYIIIDEGGLFDIQIINNFGVLIQSFTTQLTKGENQINLSLNSLPTGIYYVRVQNNAIVINKTVLKL